MCRYLKLPHPCFLVWQSLDLRDVFQKNKQENVGIFPKSGTIKSTGKFLFLRFDLFISFLSFLLCSFNVPTSIFSLFLSFSKYFSHFFLIPFPFRWAFLTLLFVASLFTCFRFLVYPLCPLLFHLCLHAFDFLVYPLCLLLFHICLHAFYSLFLNLRTASTQTVVFF